MFCEKCGKQIPDGSKFCNNCGATQHAVQPVPAPEPKPEPAPEMSFWRSLWVKNKIVVCIASAVFLLAVIAASLPRDYNKQPPRPAAPAEQVLTAKQSAQLESYDATISATGNYVNITGSVKNVGTRAIRDVKLRYEALGDGDRVVDSADVIAFGEIRPGESKTFSRMVRKTGNGQYRLYVTNAYFK